MARKAIRPPSTISCCGPLLVIESVRGTCWTLLVPETLDSQELHSPQKGTYLVQACKMQSILLPFPCPNIVLLILPVARSCTRSTHKWHLAALLPHASAYSTNLRSKQAVEPANQLTITHAASVWQSSWNHRKQSRRLGGELAEHCGIGGTRCVLSLYTAYEGAHSAGGCATMF